MSQAILDRYRCPEEFLGIGSSAPLPSASRFFRFGADILCYGKCTQTGSDEGPAPDLAGGVQFQGKKLLLPFEPSEVIENLRCERYLQASASIATVPPSGLRNLYYLLRPGLPQPVRKYLQRVYLHGWEKIQYPSWPLDTTVDRLLEKLLLLSMQAAGVEEMPFIWFWPAGASSAAIMTHDVETASGRDFCKPLMDINESFGIRGSFQIVPEKRYSVPPDFLGELRSRGNEINVQDLNHDGLLFSERKEFERRVKLINEYGRTYGSKGFRAAVLYRNVEWFDRLEFEYDMSMPNVGHVEPQRGGCCTVFPYWIGGILELPVTTTQDYSVFHILQQYNLDLWRTQAAGIMNRHGLMTFIAHPDYLQESRAQATYRSLLGFLSKCRDEHGLWMATPGEVNEWWRQRNRMKLVRRDEAWHIEGPGKERACIAYAVAGKDRLVYKLEGRDSRAELSGVTPNSHMFSGNMEEHAAMIQCRMSNVGVPG